MTEAQIIHVQRRIGAEADGYWGPKSEKACRAYLLDLMPRPHPFPKPSQVTAFYGPHGDEHFTPPTRKIELPFAIYYGERRVTTLNPHVKCADSLERVFQRLGGIYPTEQARKAAGIATYDGLYNPRLMRGSSTKWSMHSWAIAIDLDAGDNGNSTHWPTKATMPLEVMECFAKEGWTAAGAFWGRDAMHFEATNPA